MGFAAFYGEWQEEDKLSPVPAHILTMPQRLFSKAVDGEQRFCVCEWDREFEKNQLLVFREVVEDDFGEYYSGNVLNARLDQVLYPLNGDGVRLEEGTCMLFFTRVFASHAGKDRSWGETRRRPKPLDWEACSCGERWPPEFWEMCDDVEECPKCQRDGRKCRHEDYATVSFGVYVCNDCGAETRPAWPEELK